MRLITESSELEAFCRAVAGEAFITVDTEFIREKTYYPKLCLIQIAGSERAGLIDPLADGIDLAPVFALMRKADLLKVFHSGRQDIEIFYQLSGDIPTPLFDTQIAAAVCGYGESAGYEALVSQIVGLSIDKSSRFTDWSARPLSEKQLAYALSDVTHLRTVYEALRLKIEAGGRESWIAEEHASLSDPTLYRPDPDQAWMRLRAGNLRPKQMAALRELARWREIEAKTADVPRGRIVRDEALVELAHTLPRKAEDIAALRNVSGGLPKRHIPAILEAVERALALPASAYPPAAKSRRGGRDAAGLLSMLQLLLKVEAERAGVAASLIASKDELETIALSGLASAPGLAHGWRYELFGRKAQALMEGRLTFRFNPNTRLVDIHSSDL